MKNKVIHILILVAFIFSCEKEGQIIEDNGEGITIEFLEGLNDDPTYQLSKD